MTDDNKGHGHGKTYKVMVNGREKTVTKEMLTFAEVVALTFEASPNDTTVFTVTYRHADQHPEDGTLVAGQSVKVKENGTIFNVTATNKS